MYDERAEYKLMDILHSRPHTAGSAARELKNTEYRDIDRKTVKRILEKMKSEKQIDSFMIGEILLWSDKKLARNIKQNL